MSKTVLVAEDDPVSLELTRHQLTRAGFQVLTATDGQKALNIVQETVPDIILLDVEMPNMNGYTFLSEVQKLGDAQAAVPVIVLTSHDNMEPIFLRKGVKYYLVKPLDTQALITKVNDILEGVGEADV